MGTHVLLKRKQKQKTKNKFFETKVTEKRPKQLAKTGLAVGKLTRQLPLIRI